MQFSSAWRTGRRGESCLASIRRSDRQRPTFLALGKASPAAEPGAPAAPFRGDQKPSFHQPGGSSSPNSCLCSRSSFFNASAVALWSGNFPPVPVSSAKPIQLAHQATRCGTIPLCTRLPRVVSAFRYLLDVRDQLNQLIDVVASHLCPRQSLVLPNPEVATRRLDRVTNMATNEKPPRDDRGGL